MKNKLSILFATFNILILCLLTFATYLVCRNYIETISTSKLASNAFLKLILFKQNYLILIFGFLLAIAIYLKEKLTSKNITVLINIIIFSTFIIYAFWFYGVITDHLQNLILQTTNQLN